MAQKMVTSFRRSLSFPNPPSKPQKALHVRSISLPTLPHPIISHLKDKIAELKTWRLGSESGSRTLTWLCDGLNRLKSIHESLDDLLFLPQSRESLRCGKYFYLTEKLLEDFLRLVDVYGMFQMLVLRLKSEYSAAQIAVRRKDDYKIAAHSKNLNKIAKEISKLIPNVISNGKLTLDPAGPPYEYDDEAELIEVINDVVKVTVLVSVALFGGISGSLAFRRTSTFMGLILGKNTSKNVTVEVGIRKFQEINLENYKKMHELEDCIVEIEGCGEKAFRSLINTRVSLLNVVTQ
ncbi:hypothetical protein ACJIZ3_024725 [Penstemon smallii]|uniref:Uncharacterized protein n=1 Tax=Penstemon smallii TaxID=265156 RepID=A0ABD3TSN4_9LAMI